MKQQTLSGVTLKTIENYRHAAEQALEAYRAGGHRIVDALNQRLDRSVYARAEKIAPRVGRQLQRVRGRVAELAIDGIDRLSAQTGKAIDFGSTTAATQVAKAAERVATIQSPVLANGLRAAARLSMAGAQVALSLSARLADGAMVLSSVAGGRTRRGAKAGARKTAARTERATVAVPRKAKNLREVVAAKKTRPTAVRRAAKPAATPAAKPAVQRRRAAKVAEVAA